MSVNPNYSKNFLVKVICRIDFGTPLKGYNNNLPDELFEIVKVNYPIFTPLNTIRQEVLFQMNKPPDIKTESNSEKIWKFNSLEKNKAITISSEYVILEYNKYTNSEELRRDFYPVIKWILEQNQDAIISRSGLRYINHISLPHISPLSWRSYINNSLTSFLKFSEEESLLSRGIGILEFSYDFFNLKFQFGMPNPDYPSRIYKKIFIIDIDANSQTPLTNFIELERNINAYISKSEEIFEKSIKDKIRSMMHE